MSNAEWIALVALVVSIICGAIAYTAPHHRMKKTERTPPRHRMEKAELSDDTEILREILDTSKHPKEQRLDMRLESDTVKKSDEWRREQLDLPSRAEALDDAEKRQR